MQFIALSCFHTECSNPLFIHSSYQHACDVTVCCDQVEYFLTCSWGRKGTKSTPELCTAPCIPLHVCKLQPHTHFTDFLSHSCAEHFWTWKTAVEFIFIKDTSKVSLHLWGSSSSPTPFPVERCCPALPVRSSGSRTAMAWLRVDFWGLRLPGEMKEESGAQEMQESPAGGTRALFATFSPDSVQIWGLINTTISDSWHTNLFLS